MKKIFTLTLLIAVLTACAGRIPSPKSAQSLTNSYFKSYGRKYKTSFVGLGKLQKVAINRVEEESRHLAEIDAFLNFADGKTARVLVTAKNTPPFGWDVLSWELLDLQ